MSARVFQAIETRYHGPGNVRGARVSARTPGDSRIVLDWDHRLDPIENHQAAAKALAKKLEWKGRMVTGGTKNAYVHVFAGKGGFNA